MRWVSTSLLVILSVSFLCASAPASCQTAAPSGATNPEPQSQRPTFASPPEAESIPANAPRIKQQTRLEIIHDFQTQLVYARTSFPMGTKGLELKGGVISPNGEEMQQALAIWGPAIKPGDPVQISWVQITKDHIHFELNGGAVRRKKWYERIEVSGAAPVTVAPGAKPDNPRNNVHGSSLDIYFDRYVPEMTAQQLRSLLYPAFDFNARSKEQAYLDTVPPKVKEAIQAHRVLVGMDSEMVVYAKGKPPRKVREREGDTEYEEWVYGQPPADVDFVRFVGGEVVRVETMKVDGQKIVRTEKEVVLPDRDKQKEAKKEQEEKPANAPSLRRPGEDQEDVPKPAQGSTPGTPMPPPDLPTPTPPSGPGMIVATR